MLGRLRRRPARREGPVALGIHPDGVSLVVLDRAGDGRARAQVCEFLPAADSDGLQHVLKAAVERHGLAGRRCFFVLPRECYSLRTLEAPAVPEAELRDALRWQVGELIDFDLEDARIDGIVLPQGGAEGPRRLNAVIARASLLENTLATLRASGLGPATPELPELALRNVVAALPGGDSGTAVLETTLKGVHLSLFRERHLYLTRDIPIHPSQLEGAVDDAGLDGSDESFSVGGPAEQLALEIQRSLDYYEREFRQPPISRLRIAPSEFEWSTLAAQLNGTLTASVSLLELGEIADCAQTLPQAAAARCLAALGATLRNETDPQVDLGEAAPVQEEGWLRARVLLPAWSALVALLLAVAGLGAWQNRAGLVELGVAQARHGEVVARVEQLTAQVEARRGEPGLARVLGELRAERDAKLRLLRSLGSQGLGNTRGLSGVLEALARSPVAGLWLSKIQVERGGASLTLEGGSLQPDGVPRWLEQLAGEESFAGKEFRQLRIERAEEPAAGVRFHVRTDAGAGS